MSVEKLNNNKNMFTILKICADIKNNLEAKNHIFKKYENPEDENTLNEITKKTKEIIEKVESLNLGDEVHTFESVFKIIDKILDIGYCCRRLGAYIFWIRFTEKLDNELWDELYDIESAIESIQFDITKMFTDYYRIATKNS